MDAWLSNIEKDTRVVPRAQKVREDKPAAARDTCYYPDGDQFKICDTAFGPSGNPRWAAGGSIAEDVIKCQLKPLVRSDYAPILFSEVEWTELQTAFPNGACDWSKPGVSQQPTIAWQSYQKGPGGEPLGNPPLSQVDDSPAAVVPEVPLAIVLPLLALALLAVGWRRAAA
jgi:hypothetical protein